MIPGSQKIHFIPSSSNSAPIKNINAITPIPWKDQIDPIAKPKCFLNHKVRPEIGNTVNMLYANPSNTPKKT